MSFRDVISTIGFATVARKVGVSRPAVSKWTRVPAQHMQALEELFAPYGHDRYSLRPDIYGRRPAGVARPRRVKQIKRKQ